MNADPISYQRAASVGLIGLICHIVFTIGLLLFGIYKNDPAAQAGSYAMIPGIIVWAGLVLVFFQHKLERVEALEAEAYATSDAARSRVFEEASAAGLIETPTANGAEIGLRIGVDRGFGVYEGQDTCWVRMYCETWEHLAADVMPASPDNFGIAIARAGCERGPDLARELLLMALEYANVIYRNLAPYLNDEEREAAGLSAVPQ